jgi:ParB family chromosome partitioning protein
MSADAPRRLGRGLEALISTARQQREPAATAPEPSDRESSELRRVRLADITPNRFQPRRTFTEPELVELEASIKANGLLQPITVRSQPGGGWELVAGERRLRAAGRLGWTEIPAVVRDFDDRAMLTLALVENLQRADLNPLEEAEGYQRLIEDFGLTQQQVADAVGKDRTSITNLLRVLTLPTAIRAMVERGHLTAGHARALLPVKDERQQLALANEIVARGLSVREAEARARAHTSDEGGRAKAGTAAATRSLPGALPRVAASTDPAVRRIEEQLRKHLQTDVHVQPLGNDRGVVRISYYSADDLERVLDLVVGGGRSDFD